MNFSIVTVMIAIVAVIILARTARVVPQQQVFVVERLGRYRASLKAGFHLLIPFLDRVAYRHSLKERAIDVPQQVCITRDNVQISVDGVLYMQIFDAQRASYGIGDYVFAIAQLAQTTLRSEVGKIDLDRTFEERGDDQLGRGSGGGSRQRPLGGEDSPLRNPRHHPADRRAERHGEADARRAGKARHHPRFGRGSGRADQPRRGRENKRVLRESEAQRQRQINEAEGEAQAILAVATATAEGIRQVGEAISAPGGQDAARVRVAEQYVSEFGHLARTTNTLILPANRLGRRWLRRYRDGSHQEHGQDLSESLARVPNLLAARRPSAGSDSAGLCRCGGETAQQPSRRGRSVLHRAPDLFRGQRRIQVFDSVGA